MIEIETCPKCNGTGLVQIAPNVRGLKRCPYCNGYGGKIKTKREMEDTPDVRRICCLCRKSFMTNRKYPNQICSPCIGGMSTVTEEDDNRMTRVREDGTVYYDPRGR